MSGRRKTAPGMFFLNAWALIALAFTLGFNDNGGSFPELTITSNIPVIFQNDVSVPVGFTSNGTEITTVVFSIDYDSQCLDIDGTDSNEDGIPDSVNVVVPKAFTVLLHFDSNDTDGELDFIIGDVSPLVATLQDGVLIEITFTPTCVPDPGESIIAHVDFSQDPSATFSDTLAFPIQGSTSDGSVEIEMICGDQNSDGIVDLIDAIIDLKISVGNITPVSPLDIIGDVDQNNMIDREDALVILQNAIKDNDPLRCGLPDS